MRADPELRRILIAAFPGCRIDGCEELVGGVSARAVVADVVPDGGAQRRVVVRRPTYPTREEARRVVNAEYALLARCAAFGVPAPKPLFLDPEVEALVLEFVEGAPDLAPADLDDMLRQMAGQLARIHGIRPGVELDFLPRRTESVARELGTPPERLDTSLDEPRLRALVAKLWPWPEHNARALLHGDYWPGNLLWKDRKLVAVLDWEEAEIGDPLADVAVARLELLWAFGEGAMQTFTEYYRELTRIDWRNLARWDLCAALRPMSNLPRWARAYENPPISRPDVTEHSMRDGHARFVAGALRALRSAGICDGAEP